ncbi:MAG: hypothetical protein WBL23_13965 [Salinisphaera sp.]|uniref:hypothetical protein n=1 Tax=Salinisphaera sp. TaxID=1914330 RepID=UPI003C7DACF5
MHSGNFRAPFQPCRRKDGKQRAFLPVRLPMFHFLLRFIDGTQEQYRLRYDAGIEAEESPRCWRYRGHISRHLSIYNRAGEEFEKTGIDRRFELTPALNHGVDTADWRRWREGRGGREPSQTGDEFEEIYRELMRSFAMAVMADKRRVEEQFRYLYQGVEAVSEVD